MENLYRNLQRSLRGMLEDFVEGSKKIMDWIEEMDGFDCGFFG